VIERLRESFSPGAFFGWLCFAFVLMIPVLWWRFRRVRSLPTIRFSSVNLMEGTGRSWIVRTRWLPTMLRSLAIAALVLALARPQSGGGYRDLREGIAIQMVLDVSGSMAEQDFQINGQPARRMDAVKTVFEDFVLGRGGLPGRENDLIGLTTFAMFADTPCPLTLDHGSLVDLLRQTDIPGWVGGRKVRDQEEAGFTALGDGIVMATDDLRRAGEQAVAGVPGAESARSKVMILLTDGKNNPAPAAAGFPAAPNPQDAAKVAASLGIRIYTIGAVSGLDRRRGGIFAPRVEVDEDAMKEIAQTGGGKYFRATDVNSLGQVYEEISRLEKRRTGEREYRDNTGAAKLAMLVGLGLLLVEVMLVITRYRRIP